MKSTTAAAAGITALLTLFSSTALAQTIQSKPFHLVLTNTTEKYNSSTLDACHEGAGIESLCLGSKQINSNTSEFQLNTTKGETNPLPSAGQSGTLTYALKGSTFTDSEGLVFSYDPSTNVALPLFGLGDLYTQVAFDAHGLMNVQTPYDDTTVPPSDDKQRAYYRWFVCESNFEGYKYTTLNWVAGRAGPQNPSCVKTEVKRVFA